MAMRQLFKWDSASSMRMVHGAGASLVLAGLIFWGYQLTASPPAAPSRPAAPTLVVDSASEAVARWLGPGEVRLDINVVGLVRRRDRAVALLGINDAPPAAYITGETLMRDVTLSSIEPDGVTVNHSGRTLRILAPARLDSDPQGIVRVN